MTGWLPSVAAPHLPECSHSAFLRPVIPDGRRKWTISSGITGRFGPERVDDLLRNGWTILAGTGGRFESERVDDLLRNTQPIPISGDDLARARQNLWVLLPQEVHERHVRAGFSRKGARPYTPDRANGRLRIAIKLREYSDSPELLSGQGFAFKLWLDGLSDGLILIRNRRLLCLQRGCSFTCDSSEEMITHLRQEHIGDLSRKVEYEEIAENEEELPAQIYVCRYCGHYVKVGRRGATDEIIHHQTKECKKRGSDTHIRFRSVSDPEEIRRHVIPDLPDYIGCHFCGEVFKSADGAQAVEHAIKNHADRLWRVER